MTKNKVSIKKKNKWAQSIAVIEHLLKLILVTCHMMGLVKQLLSYNEVLFPLLHIKHALSSAKPHLHKVPFWVTLVEQ